MASILVNGSSKIMRSAETLTEDIPGMKLSKMRVVELVAVAHKVTEAQSAVAILLQTGD